MKKLFLLLIFLPLMAEAQDFNYNGLHYVGDLVNTVYTDGFDTNERKPSAGVPAVVKDEKDNKKYRVTRISRFAFDGEVGLISFSIGSNVTTIGASAFHNCTNLKEVNIPDKVIEINSNVFEGCASLASIKIPDGVEIIYTKAFKNSGLNAIVIPNSVIRMDDKAFEDCILLESVSIGYGLKILSENVFSGCSNLKSVSFVGKETSINGIKVIKYNIETIKSNCFLNCNSLKSIDIPPSVYAIESGAFECKSLVNVSVHWKEESDIPNINDNNFPSRKYGILHVPKGKQKIYSEKNVWKEFKIIDDLQE